MRYLTLVLVLFIGFNIKAQNGTKNFIDQNYIEVTGKAELHITPDIIKLKIIIDEESINKKVTIQEAEDILKKKLIKLSIDISKDLSIMDMDNDIKSMFLGYKRKENSRVFQLVLHDAKKVNEVYIELEKLGLNKISLLKLEHSKIIEYRNKVKVNAIKAAKEKAQMLAEAVGQKSGRAIFIQENNNISSRYSYSYSNDINDISVVDKGVDLSIDFNNIILTYTVLCRFELK